MTQAAQGNVYMLSDTQRRIRRSRLLFTAPLVLLLLLTAVLCWETIRGNVQAGSRDEWPWRLQLMDAQALGSLLAVAVGAVLARAQFARATRPYIGWRGSWVKGVLRPGAPAWRVGILNGGQHLAVIESWHCRVVLKGTVDSPDAPWASVHDTVAELTGAGLSAEDDFRLIGFGAGFPLVGGGGYETVLMAAFSEHFVERVQSVYVRARIMDVVGDTHERTMDCMKGLTPVSEAPPG